MKRVLLMLVVAGLMVAGSGCKKHEKTATPAKTTVVKKGRTPRAPRAKKSAEVAKTVAAPVAPKV